MLYRMSQALTPEERVYLRLQEIAAKASEHGISLDAVRTRANVSQPSWSRWINRKQEPKAANLIALEDAIEELIGAEASA